MDKLDNEDYNSLKRLQKMKEGIIRNCKGRMGDSATERFREILRGKEKGKGVRGGVLAERKNSLQVEQPKRKEIFSRKNSENKGPAGRF